MRLARERTRAARRAQVCEDSMRRFIRIGLCTLAGLAALLTAAPAIAQTPVPVARISLPQALQMAVARNQALQAQRLAVDAARADEITAGLKPNIGLSVGADGFTPFSPRQMNGDFLKNDASYSTSASYLFERGGKRQARIAVAKAATDVTAKSVLDAERTVRFQTAQAFVGVLLAKSTLDLSKQNLESFAQVVAVNQQRVASGDLAEAEFYRIHLQQLQFEQDVSAAEVALVQARANLRQLLGFDAVAENFEAEGDLSYAPQAADLESLKQQALQSRADYLAAQSSVTLAQNTLTLERSNRARDVSGDLDYSHTGPDNTMGVGVSIDLPIHDRNQGNIARSQVLVRQATEQELAARYLVITDVVNAYAAWQTSQKVVALYQSGYLNQAQQSLDISRYVYQRGAGNLLDLLDAERTYRDTQLGYRQALADYMTSVHQLNFAVGKQVLP
jgi:cobalt-zinc-cadmium efflux system outer membrane protein